MTKEPMGSFTEAVTEALAPLPPAHLELLLSCLHARGIIARYAFAPPPEPPGLRGLCGMYDPSNITPLPKPARGLGPPAIEALADHLGQLSIAQLRDLTEKLEKLWSPCP